MNNKQSLSDDFFFTVFVARNRMMSFNRLKATRPGKLNRSMSDSFDQNVLNCFPLIHCLSRIIDYAFTKLVFM
jgi:hypothetical protein